MFEEDLFEIPKNCNSHNSDIYRKHTPKFQTQFSIDCRRDENSPLKIQSLAK